MFLDTINFLVAAAMVAVDVLAPIVVVEADIALEPEVKSLTLELERERLREGAIYSIQSASVVERIPTKEQNKMLDRR